MIQQLAIVGIAITYTIRHVESPLNSYRYQDFIDKEWVIYLLIIISLSLYH